MLVRLIYVSRYSNNFSSRRDDLDRIIESSQRNNRNAAITGFLMATDTCFAQILEGKRTDVAATYGRIVIDPRHANIRIVMESSVGLRCFGQWSMGLAEREEDTRRVFSDYGIKTGCDLISATPNALLDLGISLSFRQTKLGQPVPIA